MSNPKGMAALMQQAQRMQRKIAKIQEEMAERTAEAEAGGGMVKAVANGKNQVISIHVEKEVVDPAEIEMLQDLIVAAVNQALKKAQEMVEEEMSKVTGGMNIPGLSGLF